MPRGTGGPDRPVVTFPGATSSPPSLRRRRASRRLAAAIPYTLTDGTFTLNPTNLRKNGFELLLATLDPASGVAAEKYEDLRLRLTTYFLWSCGCPESEADDLADRTLDRVASKLEQGVSVESVRAYSLTVARFIWLERVREPREDSYGDDLPDVPAEAPADEEPDERYTCLESCLKEAIRNPSDRELILGYYDTEAGEKNKDHRKDLAGRLGIEVGALKVRACRLRKSLEKCIVECVASRSRRP